jgi:Orn/Lys/Arg decarboxylase-like protein
MESIRDYLALQRTPLVQKLTGWIRLRSVAGLPEHEIDLTRSANWLAAVLRGIGFPTHDTIGHPPAVALPEPRALELETVMLPRDAFFARTEQIPAEQAIGRIAAEMASPYPPGVPVYAPGEVITAEAIEYLSTGVQAGMLVPDVADSSLKTVRVVAG